MDARCSRCGSQVPSQGRICPRCEIAVAHKPLPTEHQRRRARGAFGGAFYGLIAAPILIIPGILLCLLGWGLVPGIPMIVLGILLPFAAPIFGMGEHKGNCPSCGTRMVSVEDGKKHACPICGVTFAIEDQCAVASDEHRRRRA